MRNKRILETAVTRSANEVRNYRVLRRLLLILVIAFVIALSTTYLITVLYNKFGSFTVMVNKFDQVDYGLVLSPTPDFSTPSARLNCHAEKEITNISSTTIPTWLDNVDGEHNGDNYVACTFYCKNTGTKILNYTYMLYITNMTKDIEKAVRVRLYVDGSYIDYAYPRTDGGEGVEPGTTKFYSGDTIAFDTIKDFYPGTMTKYTVVIWLEGDDPDCIDAIIGGEFKIDMQISVISVVDIEK